MSAGLLFSQMTPPPGLEGEFREWYEEEHIPARMAIPGFASAQRYRVLEGEPEYLACYFLDEMGALETPAYAELKRDPGARTARMLESVSGFTRYICDQISDTGDPGEPTGMLSVVAFPVDPADAERFEAWYEGEHVPMLMRAPGWLRVRRYLVRAGGDGPAWTHIALHELRDREAMDAPERAAARETPGRDALASLPWFGASGRWLYEPIHHAVADNPTRERGA